MPYPHAESVSLPVKTSASALIARRAASEEDFGFDAGEFYESDADAETGTAYHAFLEHADFAASACEEAARVCDLLDSEGAGGKVDRKKAEKILQMPVFSKLQGFTLYREREFLLALPACEILPTSSRDEILLQGKIDLMALRGEECIIVDYKYSSHSAERVLADYAQQLNIYVAAAKRLPGVKKVSAYIVNILREYTVQAL